MDYAIIGGDARFACLTMLLRREGVDARFIGGADGGYRVPRAEIEDVGTAGNIVANWPCAHSEQIAMRARPNCRIFCCGPGAPVKEPPSCEWINLWKDERLQLENAWLTAEGAICSAMSRLDRSLRDCRCMVIGWGRIGRALTEMLIGLRAEVAVASRSEKGRNGAIERGAESVSTYYMEEALKDRDVIFSTPPCRLLGDELLRHVNRGAKIIDLASAPYGVDLEAAERMNLEAWREPGIPGRHCPFSAAQVLLQAIRRAERMDRP